MDYGKNVECIRLLVVTTITVIIIICCAYRFVHVIWIITIVQLSTMI